MEDGSLTIEFAFDIACPYAYLASLQVEQVAYRCGASIIWTPVLLGGLYELSNAPQGKSGSATDSMPLTKQKIIARDLQVQVKHVGAPFFKNTNHPLRTVAALRLIVGARKVDRPSITHALFRAYWLQNLDVSDMEVLDKVAHQFGIPLNAIKNEETKHQLYGNTVLALRVAIHDTRVIPAIYNAAWVEDKDISKAAVLQEVLKTAGFAAAMLLEKADQEVTKQRLRDLTAEVLNLGACGAPTFLVLDPDGKQVALIWGQDRLNIVADMLCGWRPYNEEIMQTNQEMQWSAKL